MKLRRKRLTPTEKAQFHNSPIFSNTSPLRTKAQKSCSNLLPNHNMKPIVVTPHPLLLQSVKKVTRFDGKLRDMIQEMKATLLSTQDPKGVGLAAPQVGIPLRLFLIKPYERSKVDVFINPDLIGVNPMSENAAVDQQNQQKAPVKKPRGRRKLLEGCLSIPNIWGRVGRKKEIVLTYQDEKGTTHTKSFKGYMATIIQHELDHLNGILFTKRVMEQNGKLFRSYKNEKGEDEFEEIKV